MGITFLTFLPCFHADGGVTETTSGPQKTRVTFLGPKFFFLDKWREKWEGTD